MPTQPPKMHGSFDISFAPRLLMSKNRLHPSFPLRVAGAAMAALACAAVWAEAPPGGAQSRFTVPHVPAQLVVQTIPDVPAEEIVDLLAPFGATLASVAEHAADLYLIRIGDDAQLNAAVALLEADPRVESAEPNFLFEPWVRPNDPSFLQQWSKENTGVNAPGSSGTPGADLNMTEAWDTRSSAAGVVIAIIDDGIETAHTDLAANVLGTGKCFASPESGRPCTSPDDPNPADDDDFHGTLVAGAAAAHGNNAIGIAGPAWEADILPLKVDLSAFAIVNAIDEAIEQGARIINMSFGGPVGGSAQHDAISRAEAAGILVVAAAGNADANNDVASHFPSNTPEPNVLSLAATTGRDKIASFSQWGAFSVDLAAPGVSILSTAIGGNYASASGTSFAAPHAAGVAALLLAETGAADYRQVKAHLIHGGIDGVVALGDDVPGQDKTAVAGRVASGRIDAARALAGPQAGVLVLRGVTVEDAAFGNGNGALEPGETAQLEIAIQNLWLAETAVTAALSTPDAHLLSVNDGSAKPVGDIASHGGATAGFSVTLASDLAGHEQIFLQLDLASAAGPLPSRYFYLEAASLENGVAVSGQIQRWDWDEFQSYHLQVPVGTTNLNVRTSGDGDIDLLLRHGQSPEYLISLGGGPFYYVDDQSRVSGGPNANESISIASPVPGLYHAVVVNYDRTPKTYELTASYSSPDAGGIAFSAASYEADETADNVVIGVRRDGGIGSASVEYLTTPGTATAGEDYADTGGTLTWEVGETGLKTFAVPLLDDDAEEGAETFTVTLSNAVNAAIGSPSSATVEIAENDTAAPGGGGGSNSGGPTGSGGGGSGAFGLPGVLALVVLALLKRMRARGRSPTLM